jgi:CubicO group peptidase (beta-lactamase class C family)
VAQYAVNGTVEPGFQPVRRLFGQLFGSPGRGGGSLVVRQGDRVLVDIWAGVADPAAGRAWERDSLGLSFSTSKGVASTIIHRLADRGLLSYDEPVASYWPDFAQGGKQDLTVRQLMSHQLGLDKVMDVAPTLQDALDHLGAEQRLAAATPRYRPGTPAYHGITYGWLLAGLARSITGQGMEELIQQEINEPLGIDGLHFGAPAERRERVASFVGGLGRIADVGPRAIGLLPAPIPPRRGLEALYIPRFNQAFRGTQPRLLETVMPAANGMFSAESLATMYAALANGGSVDGRTLLSPERVNEIGRIVTRERDRNMGIPVGWRLGYHQAFIPGIRATKAFGHYGYAGSGGWADPASGLSLAFVSNRVYPVHAAFGDLALFRLSRTVMLAHRKTLGQAVAAPGEPLPGPAL